MTTPLLDRLFVPMASGTIVVVAAMGCLTVLAATGHLDGPVAMSGILGVAGGHLGTTTVVTLKPVPPPVAPPPPAAATPDPQIVAMAQAGDRAPGP